MYKQNKIRETSLRRNESTEGETIEMKIERIVNNKEPINDGAPIIYTERQEGIKPEYDIRTDRFEIAIDATSAIDRTYKAKREEDYKERVEALKNKGKKDGGAESTQGTEN